MKPLKAALIALLVLGNAYPTVAQSGQSLDISGFSARIFPDVEPFAPAAAAIRAADAEAPELRWFAIGQFVGSDALAAGSGTLGYTGNVKTTARELPWSVSFGYQNLNPEGPGESLEQYSLGYRQTLFTQERFAFVLGASYRDLRDVRQNYSAAFSSELAVLPLLSMTGTVGWAVNDFEGGDRVDDIVPRMELIAGAFGEKYPLRISGEYTFDNDVTGEDYGGALVFSLPRNLTLITGAYKDDVYVAQLRLRF